ncbi:ankyrin repeat domain-containing protein [Candidatus Tisiphia endosymbiont of Nemotelus uliginosus]|uniref:ankyrin repeat domain-containing protein n=1 Tax=Candidatus Tisiphia endosymbiont of Nemotelus uliginosus TaxID=3077926 RepID=UPI0035C899ED
MPNLNQELFDAISNGKAEVVSTLLNQGANSLPTNTQFSPLTLAVDRDNPIIVKELIGRGFKVNDYDPGKRTALHHVKSVEVASILLEAGAKINQRFKNAQAGLPIDSAYIRLASAIDQAEQGG